MPRMCPDCDRLWAEYKERYSIAVGGITQTTFPSALFDADEALLHVASSRAAIRGHSERQGCDPKWVEHESS